MPNDLKALEGCPGAAELRWYLDVASHASSQAPGDHKSEHLETQAAILAKGPYAHVETLRWRLSPANEVVVTYRGADGREWDLAAILDDQERIVSAALLRPVEGVEFTGRPPNGATDHELRGIHDLFDRAYRDGDHSYLHAQLARLALGLAWQDGSVIGFNLAGKFRVDLPIVGARCLWSQGLTCVDPTTQRRGVARNLPAVTERGFVETSEHDAYVARYAHPASLLGSLQINGSPWPGRNVEEMSSSYSSATAVQRLVGRAVAAHLGSDDYDEDHWVCRGTGRPVGDPVVSIDAPSGAWEFFSSADRARGDTVLGLHWATDPPASWFS